MFVGFSECSISLLVIRILLWIGKPVKRRAYHRLRLIAFGDDNCMNPMLAGSDPCVATYEVDPVRALHQQLRHQSIVIVRAREMTISARLGFRHADCMWDISAEGVTTETF